MADDDGNGTGTEGEGEPKPKESGKELRTKLEGALAKNAELEGRLAVHEAGLAHLSEKQRKAVIRDVQDDGKELNAETLKAAAKDLGYTTEAPKPKSEGEGNEGGNEGGEGGAGDGTPDPTEEALDGFDAIDRARRQAVPNDDPTSFEHRINNAKSKEEVEALVRKEGHKVGIVHEWDVD